MVAEQRNDWTAIWFDGQKAWFENPGGRNTLVSSGRVATVPAGKDTVDLYGQSMPEKSDYPPDVPFQASFQPTPLDTWMFPSGQSYVVVGEQRASNYYARFDGADVPGDHTLVTGDQNYLLIDYNHRLLFVRADDVQLSPAGRR